MSNTTAGEPIRLDRPARRDMAHIILWKSLPAFELIWREVITENECPVLVLLCIFFIVNVIGTSPWRRGPMAK